jgi:hypothetical protein
MIVGRNDTALIDGSTIGGMRFYGNDSDGAYDECARIQVQADDTHTSTSKPSRLMLWTTASGASSPTERMRIDRSGKVGINEIDPDRTLHVNNNNAPAAKFGGTGGSGDYAIEIGQLSTGSSPGFNALGGSSMLFKMGGEEAMRIDPSRNFLVGTSTAKNSNALVQAYKSSGTIYMWLESDSLADGEYSTYRAYGDASGGAVRQTMIGVYKHANITNPGPFIFLEAEDGANRYYWTDNSDVLRSSSAPNNIGTTNGAVIGTQTSDERLKNVGENVSYGLAEVLQLQPKQYTLKTEPDTNKLGFIAQEVESIIPEAVFDTRDELEGHQEGDRTKLGMEYVQLIPVLVNAIKEQQATITDLQTRLAALEAN